MSNKSMTHRSGVSNFASVCPTYPISGRHSTSIISLRTKTRKYRNKKIKRSSENKNGEEKKRQGWKKSSQTVSSLIYLFFSKMKKKHTESRQFYQK